jgi:hypothetical protein
MFDSIYALCCIVVLATAANDVHTAVVFDPPGAPGQANGLISECLGIKSGPLLVRSNLILAVAAFVCAPLVSLR